MRKFTHLILASISLFLISCSYTVGPAAISHNYAKFNLDKRLASDEYKIIRKVSGKASSVNVLGLGGFEPTRLSVASYNDMVKNANLKLNQAIINVTAEKRVSIYPFVGVGTVNTTGTIIEFYEPGTNIYDITNSGTDKKNRFDNFQYKVGDFYSKGLTSGIVISTTLDGKHGKIISLKKGFLMWSEIQEWCKSQGDSWRLPTASEINLILSNIGYINSSLSESAQINPELIYWTSAEISANQAIAGTINGAIKVDKNKRCHIIAISDF